MLLLKFKNMFLGFCIFVLFLLSVFVVVEIYTYKINMMHFTLAFLTSLFRSVTFSAFRALPLTTPSLTLSGGNW